MKIFSMLADYPTVHYNSRQKSWDTLHFIILD